MKMKNEEEKNEDIFYWEKNLTFKLFGSFELRSFQILVCAQFFLD